MFFSVIIPSRNRPQLLRQAIESVLSQDHSSFEVVIVNDGSDGDNRLAYASMAEEWPGRARFIELDQAPRGHGPSFAINRGVENAVGEYVCFLDDDDIWTDPSNLSRAADAIQQFEADVCFSRQQAYLKGDLVPGDHWLNGLDRNDASSQEAFQTSVDELMRACNGKFAHLNTFVVRRSLYLSLSGMDEYIRYECEWDLYLRVIAAANAITYMPRVTARHNVPDPALQENVSTDMPFLQKLLFRSFVMDKALMFSPSPSIRIMAAEHKTYTLKRIAELLAGDRHYNQALFYAREARIRPLDMKWRLYIAYLALATFTE